MICNKCNKGSFQNCSTLIGKLTIDDMNGDIIDCPNYREDVCEIKGVDDMKANPPKVCKDCIHEPTCKLTAAATTLNELVQSNREEIDKRVTDGVPLFQVEVVCGYSEKRHYDLAVSPGIIPTMPLWTDGVHGVSHYVKR